jgi:hypothetical protein
MEEIYMKWLKNLLQDLKAYREAKKSLYPDPRDKYFPKIKVKSFGEDLELTSEKRGIR